MRHLKQVKYVFVSIVALLAVLATTPVGQVQASTLVTVSGPSPYASCSNNSQTGTNNVNAEVEPWVAANPANSSNLIGVSQQDRWSNGGARGLVAGVTTDGGTTWSSVVIPKITACSGNPDFLRASDPWLSFAPNGDLYHVSLSITVRPDGLTAPSALLVSKSVNGGTTSATLPSRAPTR